MILKILELKRSTYYYQNQLKTSKSKTRGRPIPGYSFDKSNQKVCDEQIKEYISEIIAGEGYCYGYYKITIVLKRKYKLVIDDKKVYRLCQEMKILKTQRKKLIINTNRVIAKNRIIDGINQLWELDIKYGYIEGEDRFFYVLEVLDIYDRKIIDYYIGLNCKGEDAALLVRNAINIRCKNNEKPVIRTDNGPQFISNVFNNECENLKLVHERIPYNTPNKNAHIESFHRLLEDDCMSINNFSNYMQAYIAILGYIEYYNNVRIHSALDYYSPNEYSQMLKEGKIKNMVCSV